MPDRASQRLKFWAALPFVLPQALAVRHTARRFAGADGPSEGLASTVQKPDSLPVRTLRMLGIGDSIVAGVGASSTEKAFVGQTARALAELFGATVHWQALGKSGYNVAQVLQGLVPVLHQQNSAQFDVIVMSVGVNDITSMTTTRTFRRALTLLLEALHAHSPSAVILLCGLPPMRKFPLLPQPLRAVMGLRAEILDRTANRVIQQLPFAIHAQLDFDPTPSQFCEDGYHPNEASYAELGAYMAEWIVTRLKDSA